MKTGYTYILTNKCRTMLYHSGPNDIVRRVKQHKSHYQKGLFPDRYNCEYCVTLRLARADKSDLSHLASAEHQPSSTNLYSVGSVKFRTNSSGFTFAAKLKKSE